VLPPVPPLLPELVPKAVVLVPPLLLPPPVPEPVPKAADPLLVPPPLLVPLPPPLLVPLPLPHPPLLPGAPPTTDALRATSGVPRPPPPPLAPPELVPEAVVLPPLPPQQERVPPPMVLPLPLVLLQGPDRSLPVAVRPPPPLASAEREEAVLGLLHGAALPIRGKTQSLHPGPGQAEQETLAPLVPPLELLVQEPPLPIYLLPGETLVPLRVEVRHLQHLVRRPARRSQQKMVPLVPLLVPRRVQGQQILPPYHQYPLYRGPDQAEQQTLALLGLLLLGLLLLGLLLGLLVPLLVLVLVPPLVLVQQRQYRVCADAAGETLGDFVQLRQ